jgi:hypothetical protein
VLIVSSHVGEWDGCYAAVAAEIARDVVRGDELLDELKVLLLELGQPRFLFLSAKRWCVVSGAAKKSAGR